MAQVHIPYISYMCNVYAFPDGICYATKSSANQQTIKRAVLPNGIEINRKTTPKINEAFTHVT